MMKFRKINHYLMALMLLSAIASIPVEAMASPHNDGGEYGKFSQIEQPLGLKVGVTLGGIALIGLELWWFMFREPPSKKPGG